MPSALTFSKKERLKSKKIIKELFEQGSSFFLHPFKISFYTLPESDSLNFPQILVSVSKRNFKKAVDRNKLKRRIREAYRKNKVSLISKIPPELHPLAIGIMYVSKERLSFNLIENRLILTFERFRKS